MRIHDLTIPDIASLRIRHLMAYKLVQSGYTDSSASIMVIVVVIAHVEEEIAVVEHPIRVRRLSPVGMWDSSLRQLTLRASAAASARLLLKEPNSLRAKRTAASRC